ncbi:MAG TPA: selenium-binding protein SBP56-related protein [Candidatus Dormibacteraeota bacterium]|nr:selenium-binding protein SBP56-related protein [Candidatus Dormibacteraeota bacterium]
MVRAVWTTCLAVVALGVAVLAVPTVHADETCMSAYMPKVTGQEDYVYVWTVGMEGVGDGSDKLVTVDANPKSATYGKVVSSVSVHGRHEAHHGGFTDDRRYLWMGGLDDSLIFVFDVASDPAKPKLVKTIDTFVKDSGGVAGPHTFFALPGRMLISGLSNAKNKGGKTALVEYNNDGQFVRTTWLPDDAQYGYDVRVQPRLNRMLTSSFTGWNNYMTEFGKVVSNPEAMKQFGNTMVVWDAHARKPLQVLEVPGAPLEIRWALQPRHNYAFTSSALTSKLWLIEQQPDGSFKASAVADIGDPSKTPLPVDISLSADDRYLFVDSFMDGTVRVFDVSDPHHPRVVHEQQIGKQLNMVSQTWDGERVYFTSSLLANWDKSGADNEQFLKAYAWDGTQLTPRFSVDFIKEGLGRPHHMHFGQTQFYKNQIYGRSPAAGAVPAPAG